MSRFSGCLSYCLTFRCNLQCGMCGFHEIEAMRELSTAELLKHFDDIPQCKLIVLTGGEPLLREDLYEIVMAASERTDRLLLQTNGVLVSDLKALILKLKETGFHKKLTVAISIDGARPETHDGIRGVKGTFDNAIKSLQILYDLNIDRSVAMTIQPDNYSEILDLYRFCEKLGAVFMAQMVVPRPVFNNSQIKDIYNQFKIIWEDVPPINEYYLRGVLYHYINKKPIIPCYIGKNPYPMIDAVGDVYACARSPWIKGNYGTEELVMGNIQNNSIKEILESKQAKRVLKELDSENCMFCWSGCSFGPSLRYIQELPEEEMRKIGQLNNSH